MIKNLLLQFEEEIKIWNLENQPVLANTIAKILIREHDFLLQDKFFLNRLA